MKIHDIVENQMRLVIAAGVGSDRERPEGGVMGREARGPSQGHADTSWPARDKPNRLHQPSIVPSMGLEKNHAFFVY